MDCRNEQCGSYYVDVNGQPLAVASATDAPANPDLRKLKKLQDAINGSTPEEKTRAQRRQTKLFADLQAAADDTTKPESARAREALAVFARDQQLEFQKAAWERQRHVFDDLRARPVGNATAQQWKKGVEADYALWHHSWQRWQSWQQGLRTYPIIDQRNLYFYNKMSIDWDQWLATRSADPAQSKASHTSYHDIVGAKAKSKAKSGSRASIGQEEAPWVKHRKRRH